MRIAAGLATAVVTTALLVTPQAAQAAPKVTKPQLTSECKKVAAQRTVPVSGAKFGRCVLNGMFGSKTHKVRTRTSAFTEVTTMKYGKKLELDSSSMGVRVIIAGGTTYLRMDKKSPWIVGSKKGDEEQRGIHAAGREIAQMNKRSGQQAAFRRGSEWTFTGKTKKVKGVKQWQYTGAPDMSATYGDVDDVTVTYWVDKFFRPVTSVAKLTVDGDTETVRATFSNYGKKVTIKAPRVG